jgi:D-arabinose 1-dehydrogenase-like Zn-dependent alcohol dehydrogenase
MGKQLSGGEQQMLSIGRALMTNPQLMILDEATEGLAPLIVAEIWRVVGAIRATGISTLIVDRNYREVLAHTDRAVVLEKGVVVMVRRRPASLARQRRAGVVPRPLAQRRAGPSAPPRALRPHGPRNGIMARRGRCRPGGRPRDLPSRRSLRPPAGQGAARHARAAGRRSAAARRPLRRVPLRPAPAGRLLRPGDGQKLDVSKGLGLPRVLGHEIAGTVVATGPDARGVAYGDRRVVYPWLGCGECSTCSAGRQHLCSYPQAIGVHRDGGFADHVLVRSADVLVDHGRVPAAQACTYACAGVTAYSALRKVAPLAAGDTLLVIGAGGVGLSAVRLARRLLPGATVRVAEVDAAKWDLAREAGADDVIDPRAEGGVRALVKATRGGVAAAIDFVGSGDSFTFGHGALRKGGKLVCVGLMGGAATVTPVMLAMRAVTVQGSYVGSLDELRELFALADEQPLPDLPIVERPLADADAALSDLRAGRVRGRIVLVA